MALTFDDTLSNAPSFDSDEEEHHLEAFDSIVLDAHSHLNRQSKPKASWLLCCSTQDRRYFATPDSPDVLRRRQKYFFGSVLTVVFSLVIAVIVLSTSSSSPPSSSPSSPSSPSPSPTPTIEAYREKAYLPPSQRQGVVASDTPLCSQAGVDVMSKLGGNAVDAAVTTALCLGVLSPASSGIGGGGFILVHSNAESKSTFVDAREFAPAAAQPGMFADLSPRSSLDGALAVAVPGELRGLEVIHNRYGKLPWSTVVEPARDMARDGFIVTSYLEDITRRQVRSPSPSYART